jgi:hypothetical protein
VEYNGVKGPAREAIKSVKARFPRVPVGPEQLRTLLS